MLVGGARPSTAPIDADPVTTSDVLFCVFTENIGIVKSKKKVPVNTSLDVSYIYRSRPS